MVKKNYIFKFCFCFISYFVINLYGTQFLQFLGMTNNILKMFIVDLLFMIIVFNLYFDDLKNDFVKIKNMNKIKLIKSLIKWILIIIIAIFVFDTIVGIIFPVIRDSIDGNNNAIDLLFKESKIYTIFKVIVFSTLAEEILYKLSLRKIINNNLIFITLSAIVYTLLNYVFVDISNFNAVFLYAVFGKFFSEIVFILAYVKNDNNIIFSMMIKLLYNLIPLSILIFN